MQKTQSGEIMFLSDKNVIYLRANMMYNYIPVELERGEGILSGCLRVCICVGEDRVPLRPAHGELINGRFELWSPKKKKRIYIEHYGSVVTTT